MNETPLPQTFAMPASPTPTSAAGHAPHTCPLCGQPNQCAQQTGRPYTHCWCMQRPALGRDWLAQHLQHAPHYAAPQSPPSCLCPACHARLEEEKTQADNNEAPVPADTAISRG